MWLAVAVAVGLLVAEFRPLRMVGSGMEPTLEEAERLVYHRYVDRQSVRPGAVIVYENAEDSGWGEPDWIVISRVLAGPGDEIAIQDGRYVVNGTAGPPVAAPGRYDVVVNVPASPESVTVPDGRYFVVQDAPNGSLDSRVLSWVHTDDILASRLWYLSPRGFFKPVE